MSKINHGQALWLGLPLEVGAGDSGVSPVWWASPGMPLSNQSTTKTLNPDVYPQQTMFGELSKGQEQQRVC